MRPHRQSQDRPRHEQIEADARRWIPPRQVRWTAQEHIPTDVRDPTASEQVRRITNTEDRHDSKQKKTAQFDRQLADIKRNRRKPDIHERSGDESDRKSV